MKGTSAAEVEVHFMNSWVFNYGSTEKRIADNAVCFT